MNLLYALTFDSSAQNRRVSKPKVAGKQPVKASVPKVSAVWTRTIIYTRTWKTFPVGEKPEKGVMNKGVMNTGSEFLSTEPTNSVFENSQQLGKYIKYAQEDRNTWHIDVVAHSIGG